MTVFHLANIMALPLHIPECIQNPPHEHHPPPFDKPLRIQIEGPLVSVKRLVPDAQWHIDVRGGMPDIQPAGIDLARVAYRFIYGQEPDEKSLTVRDESLGWVHQKRSEPSVNDNARHHPSANTNTQ